MRTARLNLTLHALSALLAAGSVAALAWGLMAPLDGGDADGARRAPSATRPAGIAPLPGLEEFAVAWDAPLRQRLDQGAPSPATGVDEVNPGGLQLALVGTIGRSLALLRTPDAAVEVRGVGESLLGAEVLAIRPAQVDVRYNGQVITLRKAPEAPPTAPEATPAP